MMKTIKTCIILLTTLTASYASAQNSSNQKKENTMKTYVIEREIPDAGKLTAEQLKGISQKSNDVISAMSPEIEWIHSYVTENKVYCVYKAESKEAIKEHAEKGGFPANNINELSTTINPSTANWP